MGFLVGLVRGLREKRKIGTEKSGNGSLPGIDSEAQQY
jgi:hypothetical protein